jgi:hypothetical protein
LEVSHNISISYNCVDLPDFNVTDEFNKTREFSSTQSTESQEFIEGKTFSKHINIIVRSFRRLI